MSKWILDIQSGTLVQAENCVIFDDFILENYPSVEDEEEFIDYAESLGTPVLQYKNPTQVHISWDAEDVQTLSMHMTDEQALEALQKVSKHLRDRSIEYGWEVLEMLLAMEGYEVTIDEEKD